MTAAARQSGGAWPGNGVVADDPRTRPYAHAWLDAYMYDYIQDGAPVTALSVARGAAADGLRTSNPLSRASALRAVQRRII